MISHRFLISLNNYGPAWNWITLRFMQFTRSALSSVTQHLIVGVQEDRIVGFCSLSLKNNFWKAGCIGNVDELVVDENYRGQGIGKKLINRIEEIAISNQCKQIELDSSFHRKEAHHFYESIGYKSRAYLFTKPLAKMS